MVSMDRRSLEVTTPGKLYPGTSKQLVFAPVAIIICFAVYSSDKVPSEESLITRISFLQTNSALPYTIRTFASSKSLLMPECNSSMTLFFRSCAFCILKVTFRHSMPYCAESLSKSIISAVRQRHFVGMHPSFKHAPPNLSASTKTVFSPAFAALTAVSYPPGPPPIIIRSA